MEAESKTHGQDGPAALPTFRLVAAGTITGGKSFWLDASKRGKEPDEQRRCSPSPDPEQHLGQAHARTIGKSDNQVV